MLASLWEDWIGPFLWGAAVGVVVAAGCTVCMWLTAPQIMGTRPELLAATLIGGFAGATGCLAVVWFHALDALYAIMHH